MRLAAQKPATPTIYQRVKTAANNKVKQVAQLGQDVQTVAKSTFRDKSQPRTLYKVLETQYARERVVNAGRKTAANLAGAATKSAIPLPGVSDLAGSTVERAIGGATEHTDTKENQAVEAAEDIGVATAAQGFGSVVGKVAKTAVPIPYVDEAVGLIADKATSAAAKYVGGKAVDGKLFAADDKKIAA